VLSPKILFFKFSILNIIYELIRIVYINNVPPKHFRLTRPPSTEKFSLIKRGSKIKNIKKTKNTFISFC
jgi:hypothetical protein